MLKTRLITLYVGKVLILLSSLIVLGLLCADVVGNLYLALGSSAPFIYFLMGGMCSGVIIVWILYCILTLLTITHDFFNSYTEH